MHFQGIEPIPEPGVDSDSDACHTGVYTVYLMKALVSLRRRAPAIGASSVTPMARAHPLTPPPPATSREAGEIQCPYCSQRSCTWPRIWFSILM